MVEILLSGELLSVLWAIFRSILSVITPGSQISTFINKFIVISSLMFTSSLMFIIVMSLMAVDMRGRRLHFSCTQSRPNFKNSMASASEKFPSTSSLESTRSTSLLLLYISHACILLTMEERKLGFGI